jgi:light-regulated signal transduction histidine kinase (bacteriophytochrome)
VTTRYFNFQGREYEFAFAQNISKEKAAEEQLKNYSENLENIINERTSEVEKQAKKLGDSQRALTYLLEDVNDSRDELKDAVDELEAVNKELESFSYSVSHDLRAPLTRMDGFSKVLLEKYSDILDDDGKHYLKRIRASSQIMAQLINELLTLSRITRREMKKEEVDISKIANIIINDIKKSDPEQKIKFEVQDGLIVMGDKTLLTFMIENLLSNAFKFTFKKDKGKISFGKTVIDDKEVIFVRDTGVGFNMKYYEKLFVAFQRLHSDKDYEGTGIGLATVLRIVNRHGGKIWAESEINVGTTFYFTL